MPLPTRRSFRLVFLALLLTAALPLVDVSGGYVLDRALLVVAGINKLQKNMGKCGKVLGCFYSFEEWN